MIAPIRDPNSGIERDPPSLMVARQMVGATLLRHDQRRDREVQPVTRWKAWLATLWMTGVVAVCVLRMLGR